VQNWNRVSLADIHVLEPLSGAFAPLRWANDHVKALLLALDPCAQGPPVSQLMRCIRLFAMTRRLVCLQSLRMHGKKTVPSTVELARRCRYEPRVHVHHAVLRFEKHDSHTFRAEKECCDSAPPQQHSTSCDCFRGFCCFLALAPRYRKSDLGVAACLLWSVLPYLIPAGKKK
jgi:hypothetical protein